MAENFLQYAGNQLPWATFTRCHGRSPYPSPPTPRALAVTSYWEAGDLSEVARFCFIHSTALKAPGTRECPRRNVAGFTVIVAPGTGNPRIHWRLAAELLNLFSPTLRLSIAATRNFTPFAYVLAGLGPRPFGVARGSRQRPLI